MKTSTKQKLIKALAAAFVLTAAGGTVFAINSISNDKVETPFNGTYNGTLTAFAEETSPSEVTGSTEVIESATQVGNLVLKKMISVGNDYMLLATSIDNVAEYKAIGYYITENGVTTKKEGNTYYTGIQVNTNTEEGTHTYSMQEIYGEYSYENAGMIVCEIPYTESAEYAVKPYLVKNDDTVVYGANGYKEGTNPYVLKNGSFEKGNLDGWTLSEKKLGDVSDAKNYWLNDSEKQEGYEFGLDGNYMFSAYAPGSEEGATGTLTSSTFTLGGRGWITFKLGGAKNGNQVCLEVLEDGTNNVIARYYNSEWKDRTDGAKSGCTLTAYKADLSAYKDKQLYIRVSDYASSDYGLFFLDSVQTYHKEVPTTGIEAKNIIDYVVYNGGFETGNLDGWTPTGNIGEVSLANDYWSGVKFQKDGTYFFHGFENKGENIGTLSSSAFTVGGSGMITYQLGAAGHWESQYVEVVESGTDAVLARYRNSQFADKGGFEGDENKVSALTLIKYKADLSAFKGKEVYIRIVDNWTAGGIGFVVFDNLNTYYPEGTEFGSDYTQAQDTLYSVVNGSFETGNLDGWTMNGDLGLVTDTEINAGWYTKNDATKDGKYLFTFVDANDRNHEGGEGSLKSSNFILKKDGTIAFKFGGAGSDAGAGLNRNVYVQICKADGTVLAKFYNDKEGRENTKLVNYYYTFNLEEDCECYFEVVDIAKDGSYRCFVLDGVAVNCSVPDPVVYTLATNQLGK